MVNSAATSPWDQSLHRRSPPRCRTTTARRARARGCSSRPLRPQRQGIERTRRRARRPSPRPERCRFGGRALTETSIVSRGTDVPNAAGHTMALHRPCHAPLGALRRAWKHLMCHACSRSRQCGSKAELTFLIRVVATGRGVSCRGPLLAQLVGNPEIAGSLELLLLSAQLLVSLYEPASLSHCPPTEHEQVVEALRGRRRRACGRTHDRAPDGDRGAAGGPTRAPERDQPDGCARPTGLAHLKAAVLRRPEPRRSRPGSQPFRYPSPDMRRLFPLLLAPLVLALCACEQAKPPEAPARPESAAHPRARGARRGRGPDRAGRFRCVQSDGGREGRLQAHEHRPVDAEPAIRLGYRRGDGEAHGQVARGVHGAHAAGDLGPDGRQARDLGGPEGLDPGTGR